jgi:hypothetical protein
MAGSADSKGIGKEVSTQTKSAADSRPRTDQEVQENPLLSGLQVGDVESRKREAERICHMVPVNDDTLLDLQKLLVADDARTRVAAAYTLG